ncbi:MAG TPA: serine/threonine protein kinase, partial [Myxococcota bacterium]|nr:serine/threonine protein kinase [Myxococcota bacterium]
FLVELEESIREMHRRGVVHLDLRHRSNVLACAEGHPVLLDFASALRLDPERWPARWLLRLLASVDRRALEKWRVRLQPPRETAPRLL